MPHPFLLAQQLPTLVPPLSGTGVLALFLWVAAAWLAGWYIGVHATQIRYATLADGQRARRALPLSFRLLLPFTVNVKRYRRAKYARLKEETEKNLVAAGYDTVVSSQEFLALRLLIPLILAPLLILVLYLLFTRMPGGLGDGIRARQHFIFISVLLYYWSMPRTWLKRILRQRHREIERALPFILDLLTLSVEAGLDFMTSLRRLIERRKVDALSEELIRAVREMQVGRTRREALKDMAERTRHPDLASVVSALVQADELGVGIGSILRIQAEQMRQRRFQRAEKLANEAPVKLLFPLVTFIFPCVFLVLLGPILLEMLRTGVF